MRASPSFAVVVLAAILPAAGGRQPGPETPLPPATRTPQLVVGHAGPHATINALAFGPDGTLYAGGLGKVVHRYKPAGGKFAAVEPLRVPVGPGNAGAVNALAVSPDGKWVAVAGRAPVRGESWTGGDDGITVEARDFTPQLKRDYGVVYLFDPADPRGGKVVRGAEAGVRALAFANPAPATGPVVVTAGIESDGAGRSFGAVRVFDAAGGKELHKPRTDFPDLSTLPGLAAWAGGDKALRVAVAWPHADRTKPGELVVWNATADTVARFPDGPRGVAVALRPRGALQLVSAAYAGRAGALAVRPADPPAAGSPVPLVGAKDRTYLPIALAPAGEATAAVVVAFTAADGKAAGVELGLVAADGVLTGRIPLTGLGPGTGAQPSLAASPDGKWLAVAGFADNRIEVYDAAALGAAPPQVIAGEPGGYARVAFLDGNRVWLGGAADEAPRGGTVFDPVARKAGPAAPGFAVDAAPGGGPLEMKHDEKAATVTVTVGGRAKTFALRADEVPTAAALLPAAPAWDKTLPPVVAVAHYHSKALVALVTLFDATDGRRLLQLGGPTLRVDGLAFSGSRSLLAAVGPDRTVAVWSLKSLAAPFAAIEGVAMVERGGKLAVAAVAPNSPARAALKVGDVVEAVGGDKGELRPVVLYRDFLLAVRALPVGGTARLRVNGAVVAVPDGRGVGHRHPLFELWVNPVANADGGRDWIGWTPGGPYDANSPAAEARLGWLTATGDPAAPTAFAAADQYRPLYYKVDFLRFLADAADFDAALLKYVATFPRTPPELTVRIDGAAETSGVRMLRAKAANLDVQLADHERLLRLDDAQLRWRAAGPGGEVGDWRVVPFRDGVATLPAPAPAWTRGAYRFEFELRETAELPPAVTAAYAVQYVPAAPAIVPRVNGAVAAGGVQSETDEIQLAADVTAAPGEDVIVTATSTGPGGDRAVTLPAGKDGRYGPVPLKLDRTAKTVVRLTARNAAAGAFARHETATADATVWYTPPVPVPQPVPRVALAVASPADAPGGPGRPFVSDAAKVRLAASLSGERPTKIEWDDGERGADGKEAWQPGEVPAAGAAATRDVTLKAGGVPYTLRVRVTAGTVSRTDAVAVVWAALPDADFGPVPATVRGSALLVAGPTRPAAGGGPFTARVVVEPVDSAAPHRAFEVGAGAAGGWTSAVELAPGTNRLALVVKNEWKEARVRCCEVRYVRPPAVAAVAPIQARGADVGDVVATVVSPAGLPPERLLLDDRVVPARVERAAAVLGVGVWRLSATDVPLAMAGAVPAAVRVAARSADGDGDALVVPVTPKKVEPPPPPPPDVVVTLVKGGPVIGPGTNLQTDDPRFEFRVRVASAAKLTRLAVRRPDAAPGQPDELPGVNAAAADAGLDLAAPLREGVNPFEVTASNGLSPVVVRFSVSYTPPPVRVVIEEVTEVRPDGTTRVLPPPPPGRPFAAASGLLSVKGRVFFGTPADAARESGYDAVIYANDVRHVPTPVDRPPPGKTEVGFVTQLFLNAPTTAVRVEVARRRQNDPLPQQPAETRVVVETSAPITQQRLHVVVVAPEEPEARRSAIAREVVVALNGEFIGDPDRFGNGPFRHKAFVGAVLYRPLVDGVNRPDISGQLQEVDAAVRNLAGGVGKGGFVNDVVLVYYQGRDLTGRDGVRRLHTSLSLTRVGSKASPGQVEDAAVRLDQLPATTGVRFVVLNVVTPDGSEPPQRITAGPMFLRYVWKDRESFGKLLGFYREAIGANPTVGTVVDWVRDAVEKIDRSGGVPTGRLSETVRERPIGTGGRPRP